MPHSVRFLLARGFTFNPDGSLSYQGVATEELAQRMKAVHKEVGNGTFKPNRENYQLTRALGNKEHPDNWEALSSLRLKGLAPWPL